MPMAIRTILHPTDYSPASEAAFAFACSLAREYFSEILLLNVVEPVAVTPLDGAVFEFSSDGLNQEKKRLERVFSLDPHVEVRREVALGNPVDEIARVAAESKASMIVMGTHGRSGFSRLLLGSVAEGVLRKVACPVLLVKQRPAVESNPEPVSRSETS